MTNPDGASITTYLVFKGTQSSYYRSFSPMRDKELSFEGQVFMTSETVLNNAPVDEKLAAIVKAARKTFLAHGFDAASMDQIALTAGVSKRTVYNRFRSKQELFGAAIEETCRELVPVNLAEIEDSLPPLELIQQLGRQILEGLLQPEALALRRIATFEAGRSPEIGQIYLTHGPQWMVNQCTPILERLASKGALKLENPRAALWQLGALITEPLLSHVLLGAAPKDIHDAVNEQVSRGAIAFMTLYGS